MTKNKLAKYIANTAVVAVVAAAGIGVYQLGTTPSEKQEIQEETEEKDFPEVVSEETEEKDEQKAEESLEDAETNLTEVEQKEEEIGSEVEKETATEPVSKETNEETQETAVAAQEKQDETETEVKDVSASASVVPELSFSEDTLMEWPVTGSVLRDYNMDETVYYATLDQYKLSSSVIVGAEEGTPVTCSARGKVYSIKEDPQTGKTLTMELGDGYQAIYGQLKDIDVQEGDMVEKGTVIGCVAAPTRYYSTEGSNLYFAMKKDGKPVDPVVYLP